MKKRVLYILFAVICLAFSCMSVSAVECEEFKGDNISAQNYYQWASPIKSYLSLANDGKLMRVEHLTYDGRVLIEYYDSSYNIISRKYIPQELPVFGGFYAAEDAYYILSGKNNPDEKDSAEVFRITKYDKAWNRLSSASLYGVNTVVPFDAGSARFAQSGKYILIRTSHEMYTDEDGYNHQANVTIMLDSEKMTITDYYTDVMNTAYGYVSHSFNQFIKVDNDKIVALDHGDAYPRSVVLIKYKKKVSSGKFVPTEYYENCSSVDMLDIAGKVGDNYTGCSVGGFEMSSSSYIAAICSVEQGSDSDVKNIYVSVLAKNSATPTLRKITQYTDSLSAPSTPHLVKTGSDSFVLLWEKDSQVCYALLDGEGNLNGSIYSLSGCLSDCVPLVFGGKLVWYVRDENEVTFYDISLSDMAVTTKKTINTYHDFKVLSASQSSVTLECTKCSQTKKGTIPSDFSIWWEIKGSNGYYSSAPDKRYHPGEKIKLAVDYDTADYNSYNVTSSNNKIISISVGSSGIIYAEMLSEGEAEITVSSEYNPKIKSTYTVSVAHAWSEKITKATCTENGKKVKTCSDCGEEQTEIIVAEGHKLSDYQTVKEATCTSQGKITATCSECDYTVSETTEKLPHDKKTSIKATSATCTKSGKTAGKKCSMCGKVTVEQETIPALGHDMGDYKVTKEPTCTAMGKKVATCTRCDEEVSESIEKIAHDKKTDIKATKATCTKSGKTAGKKCSMCGKVTVEQESIPALGHDMGDYKVTKEPTCTAMGKKVAACTRCDEEVSESIEKIAHDEKTDIKDAKATCTKEGKTAGKKCSMCGKVTVEQESIPALGHDMGDYKVTKEPTCTAMGKKVAACTRCDEEVSESIEKIAHDEKTDIKATKATCTKAGKTAGKKCSMCGKVTVEQETIPALGHDMGDYEVTKEPTCTAMGKKVATCARCDEEVSESIEKIAHDEKTDIKATKATCTKAGKTAGKKCSMCGKVTVEQETIPALGHDMGDYEVTKEPTCTAMGKKVATCARCDEEVSESIEKIAHDEKTDIKDAKATCTKEGKTAGKKCSMCGKVTVEQESIPALGHDMGDYKVTKEPTCTAQGEKESVCSRCDEKQTMTIAKLGHSYSEYEVTKEPTCTAMGEKTAYCSRCEQTVKEDIARVPHKEITINATEPTCTKNGRTQGTVCEVCGRVLKEQLTVDKLGHSIKETVAAKATKENHGELIKECTRCGDKESQRVYLIKSVSMAKDRYVYNGNTPKVTVKVIDSQKNLLREGEDYTVSVGSAKKVGTHTATVKFKGKYGGTEKLTFDIVPGKTSAVKAAESTSYLKLTWNKVSGATGYRVYQYDSKTKSYKLLTSLKGKNSYTVKKLKSGTVYNFAVKAYTKQSDGTVYWGSSVKVQFATKPAATDIALKSAAKKTAEISWNKVSGASGYQIYYASSKDGDYKKLKSTTALSYKKTGLKSGKTYYFKVRAYKKVDGKTVYGAFGKIKSVKVK